MKKKLSLAVFALAAVTAGAFLVIKNYQGSSQASLYRAAAVTKLSDTQIATIQNTSTPAGIPTGPVVTNPVSCPASGYNYVSQWGTYGSGNGQFAIPGYIASNSSGEVYVYDARNNRIQKFTSSGQYILQWGTQGSANGQFQVPNFALGDSLGGIAIDMVGNVYVVDTGNNRVEKFDSQGNYITQWGSLGAGNGQFNGPGGVAIDTSGNVYVVDRYNNRVQKFKPNGGYLSQFGTGSSSSGQFSNPTGVDNGIFLDTSGNIYITTLTGYGVKKFNSIGQYLSQVGSRGYVGNGKFMDPVGVAVDSYGNMYVVDNYQERVQKFDQNGAYIAQVGSSGYGNGQFRAPIGIAVSPQGDIYVADSSNNRIQKFSPCTPVHIPSVPISITKPDLIVEDFTWIPSAPHVRVITDPTKEPTPNTNFKVTATIKNIGSATAVLPRGTQISFLKNGTTYGAQQLMNPVTIAVGQTFDVDVYQSTTPNILGTAGTFGLTVRVDDYANGTGNVFNLVDELNENNNTLVKQMTVLP
jgi:sugar lactone lactonase YvrE